MHVVRLAPSTSTSSQAVPSTHSTTLPSPRIRKPRFSSRMGSLSPSSFNSNSNIIHNNNTIIPPSPPITPISRSTPILIPPTPNDFKLTPIPPDDEKEELPLCPEVVDQLLRGPVSWKPSSVSSACSSRCVGLRLDYSPNYVNYLFLLALDLNLNQCSHVWVCSSSTGHGGAGWSFIFYFCCFSPSIFVATPVVDLTYTQYQGVPTLDPVTNETITHFLGIR